MPLDCCLLTTVILLVGIDHSAWLHAIDGKHRRERCMKGGGSKCVWWPGIVQCLWAGSFKYLGRVPAGGTYPACLMILNLSFERSC